MRALVASLALGLWLTGAPVLAAAGEEEEEAEVATDLLHAPRPLYTFAWPDVWPRSFVNEGPEWSFGCESRVAFGDWQLVSEQRDYGGLGSWVRVANYGVFHCAANFYAAETREELAKGEFSRGLFALIGEGRAQGKTYELWVLQKGFVPGSSYVLLARDKAERQEGSIARFDVLQRECPRGRLRAADNMDVWSTRHCSIESRDELLALARKMLRKPFLGAFVRVGDALPEADKPET